MRANKKTVVLLAAVTAVLTGCAVTEEYDLYETANTAKTLFFEEVLNTNLPYARTVKSCDAELPQNQKIVAREYGDYSVIYFPEKYAGTDYCFPYVEDIANAYHVTRFQGNAGAPIEFEWIGSIELGREIHEIEELNNDNYIELTDSSDMTRLFAMSQTYENDALDSPEDIVWNLCIDADVVVVRDGLCEISEQEEGYHVLLDVESNTRKGYASVFVDTSADTMTHFVYTEALEQYDDERARTLIDNLQLSDGVITQTNDKICVEAGDRMDFVPAEYFDANPWELSQCSVDLGHKVWHTFGDYSCVISLFDQTYPLLVEVRDTTPPEFELAEISGFAVEGTVLDIDKYITKSLSEDKDLNKYMSAHAKDSSKPLKTYYKNSPNEITITEELCDENGNINITVCVEDAAGNVAEKDTKFIYVPQEETNAWFEKIDEYYGYWDEVYSYYEHSDISIERAIECAEEDYKYTKKGIEIAESGIVTIQYENKHVLCMQKFYEGLSYIPENILQEYERRGWYIKIIDDELDNWITGGESAGDTSYADKRIRYTNTPFQTDNTIPHEFGHFVDYILGMKSESAEFKKLYNERKQNRRKKDAEKSYYDEWSSEDWDGIYSGYSFANEAEFFADSFSICLRKPEKLQKHYPEIYDYIMECIGAL